jgi:hypothetical protein
MWKYVQRSGELFHNDNHVAFGYSGLHEGKNNPEMQEHGGMGPLPVGVYTIMPPRDTPTHGPYVIPLMPDTSNQMFGRSGFLIHGDSSEHPGEASHGCIILARRVREQIWKSDEPKLQVVAESIPTSEVDVA